MASRPPFIRFYGDVDVGRRFVRRGQVELYRTRELTASAGVPVFSRRSPIFEGSKSHIVTQISKNLEIIEIHIFPEELEQLEEIFEKEKPEKPEEDFGCPAGFVVYKRNKFPLTQPGHILTSLGGDQQKEGSRNWRKATLEGFEDAGNGGWYGLKDVFNKLEDSLQHRPCDVITWHGNTGTFTDNGIWHASLPGESGYGYFLEDYFMYQGIKIDGPANRRIMGACIITDKSVDYYYAVVTQTTSISNPENSGTNEQVWRRPINGSTWELIGTSDYSNWTTDTNQPVPFETCCIDSKGFAYFTKRISHGGETPANDEYACIKVDLKEGTFEKIQSSFSSMIDFTRTEISNITAVGNSPHNTGSQNEYDEYQKRYLQAQGMQYVMTLGGLPHKYDLFVKLDYQENWINDYVGETVGSVAGQCMGTDVYTLDMEWECYLYGRCIMQWVIYKDGKHLATFEAINFEYEAEGGRTATADISDICNPGTDRTQTPFTPTMSWKDRHYYFMHPIALDETRCMEREITKGWWGNGSSSKFTLKTVEGKLVDPYIYQLTRAAVSPNEDQSQRIRDPDAVGQTDVWINPGSGLFQDEYSGLENLIWGNEKGQMNATIPYFSNPSDLYNNTSISEVSLRFPLFPGGCGLGFSTVRHGYWDSESPSLANNSLYNVGGQQQNIDVNAQAPSAPGFTAVHRPIDDSEEWSYLFCLPKFTSKYMKDTQISALDAPTYDDDNIAYFYFECPRIWPAVYTGFQRIGQNIISSAIEEEAVDDKLSTSPTEFNNPVVMWWNENYSMSQWATSRTYGAGQLVLIIGDDIYRCTADHTSSASNKPGEGANWENFWERETFEVEIVSNVGLTAKLIQKLTGEPDDWIVGLAII